MCSTLNGKLIALTKQNLNLDTLPWPGGLVHIVVCDACSGMWFVPESGHKYLGQRFAGDVRRSVQLFLSLAPLAHLFQIRDSDLTFHSCTQSVGLGLPGNIIRLTVKNVTFTCQSSPLCTIDRVGPLGSARMDLARHWGPCLPVCEISTTRSDSGFSAHPLDPPLVVVSAATFVLLTPKMVLQDLQPMAHCHQPWFIKFLFRYGS